MALYFSQDMLTREWSLKGIRCWSTWTKSIISIVSAIRRIPSSWTVSACILLAFLLCLRNVVKVQLLVSLQVWCRRYHKYRCDQCIFKTSSGRNLMIAFQMAGNCQYHIICYYVLSPPPPPQYFLTTVILNVPLLLLTTLRLVILSLSFLFSLLCFFLVLFLQSNVPTIYFAYFLPVSLFISYFQVPRHLGRNSQASDIQ